MTDAAVMVLVGDKKFALQVTEVERVLRAMEITQLPDQGSNILGVVNVEGELIKVCDIRRRLGLERRDIDLNDQIVIAKAGQQKVALVVDAVQSILRYERDQYITVDKTESRLAAGVMNIGDEMIMVCDPSDLLQHNGG
jgi:purine-binding chemotaxis protein CheW